MSKYYHFCQSVRGALRLKNRELATMFKNEDGSRVLADDAREHLMDQLALGREVIPIGEPCEGFDYGKGCSGHESETEPDA